MELLGLLIIGIVGGTWGSLIGAGGGFIIVPAMLIFHPTLSPAIVTAVSLIAVLANSISGVSVYAKLKRIDYKTGLLFLLATLPGGVIGALLVNHIDKNLFQSLVGILLVMIAFYVFFKKSPSRQSLPTTSFARSITDSTGSNYKYQVRIFTGIPIVFVVGFIAGMIGVGGGIINVPAFILLVGIPLQIAVATSQFMIVGTSLASNITNILEGDLSGQWPIAITLAIGTIIGGQIGSRLSQKIASVLIVRALAAALLLVGIRLLINSLTNN